MPWLLLASLLLVSSNARADCERVGSPFGQEDLDSLRFRVHSRFGEPRTSYVRGHKHAGVDLKGEYRAAVYPICTGTVTDIQLSFPHLTIVIRHRRPDGSIFHSSYKHVTDVEVKVGDVVSASTVLARLFDEGEHRRARFGRAPNHLHFEVLSRTDDEGAASWSAMSREELERYRSDPMVLLEAGLRLDSLARRRQPADAH